MNWPSNFLISTWWRRLTTKLRARQLKLGSKSVADRGNLILELVCPQCYQTTLVNLAVVSRRLNSTAISLLYRFLYIFVDTRLPRRYKDNHKAWFQEAMKTVPGSLVDLRSKLLRISQTLQRSLHLRSLIKKNHFYSLTKEDALTVINAYWGAVGKKLPCSLRAVDLDALELLCIAAGCNQLFSVNNGEPMKFYQSLNTFLSEKKIVFKTSEKMKIAQQKQYSVNKLQPSRLELELDRKCPWPSFAEIHCQIEMTLLRCLRIFLKDELPWSVKFFVGSTAWVKENGKFPNVASLGLEWLVERAYDLDEESKFCASMFSFVQSFSRLKEVVFNNKRSSTPPMRPYTDFIQEMCDCIRHTHIELVSFVHVPFFWDLKKAVCACEHCPSLLPIIMKDVNTYFCFFTWIDLCVERTRACRPEIDLLLDPEHFPSITNRSSIIPKLPKDGDNLKLLAPQDRNEITKTDEIYLTFAIHQMRPYLKAAEHSELKFLILNGIAFKQIENRFEPIFETTTYPSNWRDRFA